MWEPCGQPQSGRPSLGVDCLELFLLGRVRGSISSTVTAEPLARIPHPLPGLHQADRHHLRVRCYGQVRSATSRNSGSWCGGLRQEGREGGCGVDLEALHRGAGNALRLRGDLSVAVPTVRGRGTPCMQGCSTISRSSRTGEFLNEACRGRRYAGSRGTARASSSRNPRNSLRSRSYLRSK